VLVPTGAVDGDRFVALDVATGQRVWSSDVPRSINPASVALREANGVMQILYHHAKPPGQSGMSAVNPADGSVLWQVDLESGMSDARPLPLPDGRVLLQTWKHSTMFAAQNATLTKGPSVLWSNDELSAGNAPPVFLDDHLYGFGGNSGEFLKCIDSRTGVVKWSTRPYRGTGILVGRTLVVQSESSGLLRLVAAEPAAYREIARLEVMKPGATTLTPPAHADGVVYVRNQEEVVAVAIR
jgi:outer membrane protein assembly factor BamB